jgi:hypothetical protein
VDLVAFSCSNQRTGTMSLIRSATPPRPIGQFRALWRLICAHTFHWEMRPFSPMAFSLDTWPLKTGPIGSPKTLVLNQPRLCNIPEDDRMQVNCSESLCSCITALSLFPQSLLGTVYFSQWIQSLDKTQIFIELEIKMYS